MKKLLSLFIATIMCFSMISTAIAAEMNFDDVQPDAWYYEDVKYAVENGLINGKTENLFAPTSSLTGSEAIKLAACIHQLYVEGSVTLKSGFPWYKPYVDYCKEKGIITENKNYPIDRAITRGDFVVIFANALPEEAYTQINDIEYGEIPDVQEEGSEYYEAAYKLYRAGILTGSGEAHKLFPDNPIIRAEVAAIVTRMVDESRRVQFTFEKKEDEAPKDENTENKDESEKDDAEENNSYMNVNVTIKPDDSENIQGNMNITDGSKNDNANSSEDDIIYGEVNTGENVTVGNVVITPEPDNTVVNGEVSTNQGNANVNILALSINLQPTSFKVTGLPARASFTVEATGGVGPYTYQWEYKESDVFENWIKLPNPVNKRGTTNTAYYSGSTTNTLKVAATEDKADILKYKFRCVITDANGNKVITNAVGFELGTLNSTTIKKGLR